MRINSAEEVPAEANAFAHCKVLGVIEKEINFEVDMPGPSDWNGKFLMGGSGGFQGTLSNSGKAPALHRGYATGITDTGHVLPEDGGASWAYQNPERLMNFGHRATHLAAATVKLVVQAFYKKPIQRSYYYARSGSGKMALSEATRYPKDFDGILAGCPGLSQTRGSGLLYAWTQQLMFPTAEDHYNFRPVIPPAKVAMLDAAVHAKCDAVDGLKDDIITNPTACHFDPMKDLPRCDADNERSDCFTAKQLDVIAKIHAGPSNSYGPIFPGFPYGGESIPGQWLAPAGGTAYVIGAADGRGARGAETRERSRHYLLGNATLRYMVFGNPNYDLHDFDFETDVPATFAASTVVDSDTPDLNLMEFKKQGGKLLMWALYSDWSSSGAYVSQAYFDRTSDEMGGPENVTDFYRLFMMPGVGHCGTIDPTKKVPNHADFLTALEKWVEQGELPERITASHYAGNPPRQFDMPVSATPDRTRPLCAYPAVATYKGSGSIDDEANFICAAASIRPR
jgi:feruloyl esterase